MKIEKKDKTLIVFLNKKISEKINITNKINLEKYFQKLFEKLNNIYELEIKGNYDVIIYNIKTYGIILEIKEKETEYYDYYDQIDMNLTLSKYDDILYKIDGYYDQIKKNCDFYTYKGILYASPKKITFQKLGLLIENSKIIYGKECEKIKELATKLNPVNI